MMAFPSMLFDAADEVKMARPADDWDENLTNEVREAYPHFYCYCLLQLGRAITWGEHWENAKIIATIPMERLKTMQLEDFLAEGLKYST